MTSSQYLLLKTFLSVVVVVLHLVEGGVVRDDPAGESKIVGGGTIKIKQAPWQVFLRVGEYMCGGSIISDRWVITAAHCTVDLAPEEIWMLVGTENRRQTKPRYYVEEVINHENYTSLERGIVNDISLLKSKTVLNLDGRPLKAVRLPKLGVTRPAVGTKLKVTGWGRTENGKGSKLLRAVDIQIRDYAECKPYGYDKPTQICAYSVNKDSCHGDSGGPLVKGNLLVGIVSYGDGYTFCGVRPGVYTDVAAFRGWIKDNSGV